MPRPSADILTERESQIMSVLWTMREATADDIRQRLPGDPHDSSVRTLLRILKEKGFVKLTKKRRPTRYRPAVTREKVQQRATSSLLARFFSGDAEALVVRLLEDEKLTRDQLKELRRTFAPGRSKEKRK